jgi:hypothetical protein
MADETGEKNGVEKLKYHRHEIGRGKLFPRKAKRQPISGWRLFLEIQGEFLVANRGIEPRTRGFSIRCSTN